MPKGIGYGKKSKPAKKGGQEAPAKKGKRKGKEPLDVPVGRREHHGSERLPGRPYAGVTRAGGGNKKAERLSADSTSRSELRSPVRRTAKEATRSRSCGSATRTWPIEGQPRAASGFGPVKCDEEVKLTAGY